jgi:stage II sporulation protein P
MRIRRGVIIARHGFLFRVAVLIVLVSLAVRTAGGRINGFITGCLLNLAERPGFAETAISSNLAGGRGTYNNQDKWVSVFKSESAVHTFSATDAEDMAETEESADDELIPWPIIDNSGEKDSFPIQTISINPVSENGYEVYDKIYLKNDSDKKIDLKYLTGTKLPFALKGKGPHVLIVHTHGSESYFPDGKDTYTPTDVERTEDKRYNVIRVGDELEAVLKKAGISVVHDRNIYDSPSYNGSYTRTLAAITEQMRKTPSIKAVIDIHRDAMTTKEGVKYRTIAEIDGKNAAQIMIVMGTGESGLPHPNWAENLKLALRLQNRVQGKYPGLMRPVSLRKERFNMHVTTGSMLIEVGTSANTLQEALHAIRLFGGELAEILKSAKSQ